MIMEIKLVSIELLLSLLLEISKKAEKVDMVM